MTITLGDAGSLHSQPETEINHTFLILLSLRQIRGNRYSLLIRNVTYMDLGNYTCQASNTLGKDRGMLTLSGIPTACYFDSVR
jgi:hypothetical protein